jgi:hypothetical protein
MDETVAGHCRAKLFVALSASECPMDVRRFDSRRLVLLVLTTVSLSELMLRWRGFLLASADAAEAKLLVSFMLLQLLGGDVARPMLVFVLIAAACGACLLLEDALVDPKDPTLLALRVWADFRSRVGVRGRRRLLGFLSRAMLSSSELSDRSLSSCCRWSSGSVAALMSIDWVNLE